MQRYYNSQMCNFKQIKINSISFLKFVTKSLVDK